jgi:N-acetylneuraminic acid mutarotase
MAWQYPPSVAGVQNRRRNVAIGIAAAVASTLSPMPASGSGGWVRLPPSLIARQEVTAAAIGDSIYVVGGASAVGLPREVERYDADTGRWALVSPLPISVNHAVAVAYHGQLYVFGGYTAFPLTLGVPTAGLADASAAFFRYDPSADRWSAMPPAPTPRAAFAGAVLGDTFYAAGGVTTLGPSNSMDEFDFRSGKWRRGPSMPVVAEHVAGAALDGLFYVLAGRSLYGATNFNTTRRFDPTTGTWQLLANMRHGHAGFPAVAVCGQIVAFGGEQPGEGLAGTIPQTESYDPAADAWTSLPNLLTARHGLGGAAVGGRVFAIEGGNITFKSVTSAVEALDTGCSATAPGKVQPAPPAPPRLGERANLSVTVRPRRVRAGRNCRFLVHVRSGRRPAASALVTYAGLRRRTDRRGVARFYICPQRPGRYRVVASARGGARGTATVTVIGERAPRRR